MEEGSLLQHREASHSRSAGKLCLKPCSPHHTIQRGLDPNDILSPPAAGQALGWEPFLCVFAFIFSCNNTQQPVNQAPGLDSSRHRPPSHQPSQSPPSGPPLPSGVNTNSLQALKTSCRTYISWCNCQQHLMVDVNYLPFTGVETRLRVATGHSCGEQDAFCWPRLSWAAHEQTGQASTSQGVPFFF